MARKRKVNADCRDSKEHVDRIERTKIIREVLSHISGLRSGDTRRICLYGEWGSGKSYVLELLEDAIEKEEDWKSRYIIVHYDADKDIFYDDPLIAMMYSLIDALKHNYRERYNRAMRPYRRAVRRQSIDKAMRGLADVSEEKKLVRVVGIFYKLLSFAVTNRRKDITENQRLADYGSYSDLLNYFKAAMNVITAGNAFGVIDGLQKGGRSCHEPYKLVIFVDEIDRCPPDRHARILECAHNLFDVKNCVVVYSLNLNVAIKYYERGFGGTGDGKKYFEKFFDYMYELPLNTDFYFVKYLREAVMEKLGSDTTTSVGNSAVRKELKMKYIWRFVSAEIAQRSPGYGGANPKSGDAGNGFNNRQANKFLEVVDKTMTDVFAATEHGEGVRYEESRYYVYAYLFCYLYMLKLCDAVTYELIRDGKLTEYTDFVGALRNDIKSPDTKDYADLFSRNNPPKPSGTRAYIVSPSGAHSSETAQVAIPEYKDPDFNTINYVLNAGTDDVKNGRIAKGFEKKITDAQELGEVLRRAMERLDSGTEF